MLNKNNYFNNSLPAIKIIGHAKCTGCFGCVNGCKFNAIEMKLSEHGFYEPKIDENKCKNCGLCQNNCPIINSKSDNFSKNKIKVYAAYSTNDKIRLDSSSGGVFTEIAERFIENNGVVFGAAWTDNLSVQHIAVRNKQDIEKLRGSKYIQSNLHNIYSKVLEIINNEEKKILFTGTPCQVAALKTFTNSENLVTIDVLCHGIPSKIVFDKYINYISDKRNVNSYTFRDKTNGWSKYSVKMLMDNGKPYECITRQDPFFHGFICDLYSNLACYNCKFAAIPRVGDITLGDFWKISEDLMDERGVSVVLANNNKGQTLLNEIEVHGKIKTFPRKLEEAVNGNPRIKSEYLKMRTKREEILNNVKKQGFKFINENYIKNTRRYVYDELENEEI
ncbi:MAG: hypothetical protein K0R54_881 [Clostridiaceae bacterium]|jgi:coenzyme F420-reducing hydrogenase beta subunit|nr:hypothetical protein [Clostridiaceae bacterium]